MPEKRPFDSDDEREFYDKYAIVKEVDVKKVPFRANKRKQTPYKQAEMDEDEEVFSPKTRRIAKEKQKLDAKNKKLDAREEREER